MQTAVEFSPSAEATCPEHPGKPSNGTCPRCGRFVCSNCNLLEGECGACRLRQLQALPLAGGRARFTMAML